MWRKNMAKSPDIKKHPKCIGVDLNRNYPFHWGGEGSSHDPCHENFCGTKAFSEPETKAVSKLILDNRKRIKAYITLHSYGNWWLYPWVRYNFIKWTLKLIFCRVIIMQILQMSKNWYSYL